MTRPTQRLARGAGWMWMAGLLCVPWVLSCGPRDPSRERFFDTVNGAGIQAGPLGRDGDMSLLDRMDSGVCVIDVDGVPPLDVFMASRADTGSRLYLGQSTDPLRWRDGTAAAGLGNVGDAVGCLTFDAEGDGDDDLLITGVGNLRLYVQVSPGVFVDGSAALSVTVPLTHALVSSAAGDLDGDGDLDLVIAGFVDVRSMMETSLCATIPCALLVDAYTGVRSYLLINQGGVFVDQTSTLAPDLLAAEPTLVVAIADLDANGSQDILVGNDVGSFHDRFLVRSGSVFQDFAMARGLATDSSGNGVNSMSIAIGDVDGDGILDVAQTAYTERHSPLWICGADGYCPDEGTLRGTLVNQSAVRWSNALFDVDLDGDLDLFEVAGDVFRNEDILPAFVGTVVFPHQDRPRLLLGDGGDFVAATPSDGLIQTFAGRGLGLGDFDEDGRLDAVIGVTYGQPAVLRNATTGGIPLRITLHGLGGNSRGIGARVQVTSLGLSQLRVVRAGEGYASSFDPRVYFGFPTEGTVDVTVTWASGRVSTMIGATLGPGLTELSIDEATAL